MLDHRRRGDDELRAAVMTGLDALLNFQMKI